tara:strand:- start:409 stop:615 length:207 start_codon:yes stop_codon:yes gene_type:complete
MGYKRAMVNAFFRAKRHLRYAATNKKVRKVVYRSYQVYQVSRIIRNPFIILDYISVYRGLLLLGNRAV